MATTIQKDSTGNIAVVRVLDFDGFPWTGVVYNEAGLEVWYTPKGGTPVQITLSVSNWAETKNGSYEVDVPDAAYEQSAQLEITGAITEGVIIPDTHMIVEYDPAVIDKAGYILAATGLDSITATEPTGRPTTFSGWVMWLVQRFRSADKSATAIEVKSEAGVVITTQAITQVDKNETLGAPVEP